MRAVINNVAYDVASKEAAALTEGLIRTHEALGNPTDITTPSGWKMVDAIMGVWINFYPHEVRAWKKELEIQLGTERTVHDAVSSDGGYFPLSYPTRVFRMLTNFFPDAKLGEMEFLKQLVGRYPMLKMTNYKL